MARRLLFRLVRLIVLAALLAIVMVQVVRVHQAVTGPPLAAWHTFVPDEPSAGEIDRFDWAEWIAAEDRLRAEVRDHLAGALDPADEVPENRFFAGSPLNPYNFPVDWNRSFILEPEGAPRGAAVFLHGLTDAPYSLRHLAEFYRDQGFVAVAVRMPGHGTVPGGLTRADWPEWLATTRLAVREARRLAGGDNPLHIIGYSNGGALAVKYALDAVEDERLDRADRLVLLSPMIGVTGFARFAGLAGWPAVIPGFVRAAWLNTMVEFNPFKYNSFPVNAARQTHLLTRALQRQIDRMERNGQLAELPPILTFQSLVDATVSTRAVIDALYAKLPDNGSEFVVYDLNRSAFVAPLIRSATAELLTHLLPPAVRNFSYTVITNAGTGDPGMVAVRTAAETGVAETVPFDAVFPRDIYSLSHVALPFPPSDGLYGGDPDPLDNFGINLGTLSVRGESGVLSTGMETLTRISFNPFFDDMLDRIGAVVGTP
jgi:alpha-beta hydrolase superfamily lysophospholipase